MRGDVKGAEDAVIATLFNKPEDFFSIHKPDAAAMPAIRAFFRAYATDGGVRTIIDAREFGRLADNPKVSPADVKALGSWRDVIPEYVKDYVPLNAFMQPTITT